MKTLCLLLASVSLAAAQGDFTLTVDGKNFDLSLGKPQQLTLPNGQKVSVSLTRKEIVTFDAKLFSFQHKSVYSPNRVDLGDGVHQTFFATPLGTTILLQEYSSMNASGLIDLMIQELTKEEIKAGYKLKQKRIEKKLADGTVLKGKEAVTTYRDTEWTRCVLACDVGDQGVLVVTGIEKEELATETPIIDLLWKSLQIKKAK